MYNSIRSANPDRQEYSDTALMCSINTYVILIYLLYTIDSGRIYRSAVDNFCHPTTWSSPKPRCHGYRGCIDRVPVSLDVDGHGRAEGGICIFIYRSGRSWLRRIVVVATLSERGAFASPLLVRQAASRPLANAKVCRAIVDDAAGCIRCATARAHRSGVRIYDDSTVAACCRDSSSSR